MVCAANLHTLSPGQDAARYFKYMRRTFQSRAIREFDLNRVASKSFYTKYKAHFDKLAQLFAKYEIDVYAYISFFVVELGKTEHNIQTDLLSKQSFDAFEVYLRREEKRKKIYSWFMKSVDNIVQDCMQLNLFSVKDYLRHLIETKKLGNKYFAGKISAYWFAGIPSFNKLIEKLDARTRAEFSDLLKNFDIYNTEVNETFLQIKKTKANPIRLTDQALFARRSNCE